MKNYKVKIIAEAGVNHDGSLFKAKKLILAAKKSGADFVKFQAFDADELCLEDSIKADYQKRDNSKETQYQMLKKLSLSQSKIKLLFKYARQQKIKLMFSVFDNLSLKFINRCNFEFIKLPSGEINNYKLIKDLALSKSKIIFSSGASNLNDIKNCLKILTRKKKLRDITLMHCNSEYPTPLEDLNLNVINTLKKKFRTNIGFSDHSKSIIAPSLAVALGANMIEKHFTLNQNSKGPDHSSSLNPTQFKTMVENLRETEISLGSFHKKITNSEKKNVNIIRKSVVAKKKINKNQKFTIYNITTKRPGGGIPASNFFKLIGKKSSRNYLPNELIKK